MKSLVGLLAILAVANGLSPGVRVRFDMGFSGFGESFFYSVPTTMDDAIETGWRRYRRPSGPLPQLQMHCADDKTVCGLYDDTRYIAGLQVALRDTEFDSEFDYTERGFTRWETTVDGQCATLWAIQQYFVSEETFEQSLESRLESRNTSKILQEGAVWFTGTNGEITRISTDENAITETDFVQQRCMPMMGRHYFYNMTSSAECTADQMYPWFLLFTDGEMLSNGFITMGQLTVPSGRRNWFETPSWLVLLIILAQGPSCVYDFASQGSLLTMHIYYVDDPRQISC